MRWRAWFVEPRAPDLRWGVVVFLRFSTPRGREIELALQAAREMLRLRTQ